MKNGTPIALNLLWMDKILHDVIVPLGLIEYGVYGDLIIIYPKPYSIYLRGTIGMLFSP